MKDVWSACRFRSDVTSEDLSKTKFAVELHQFLDGTAERTYQDPRTFFENTFLTDQMKLLVRDTLSRLDNGGGQPVTVIDTGFGGGKTHSLLLLHHILTSPDIGLEFVRDRGVATDLGINTIPWVRIIEIDCRAITKKTLWGEIAYRLGRYSEFEDMDVQLRPPMNITKLKNLFDGPILLMLDELPHYLSKADSIKAGDTTLSNLTITYIMELISAIASTPKACMILTLTEKQSLYEKYTREVLKTITDYRVDDIAGDLKEALSRQTSVITPVESNQIYDVVKARLVEYVDEESKRATIQEYADYYEKHGMDVGNILDKMERSYPFHPSLIDILYGRISTIPKFNKTRGMLRLLALIIKQVMEDKPVCSMIGTSEVRFDNAQIRDELTVRLDQNLGTVMDVDCVEHAQEADRSKSVSVVYPIASTIMLFSLHGHQNKSGMKRGEIKVAMGHPGLDPSLVDKALDEDILHSFWYIHDTGGESFYFAEFPNIVAIIDDYRKYITPAETKDEIRRALTGLLPSDGMQVILWDRSGLIDDYRLKLFVTEYDVDLSGDDGHNFMTNILNKSGDGIRTHKNTITVLYPDKGVVPLLERTARTVAGIKKAEKDERVKVDKRFVKDMNGRKTEALGQLESYCTTAYSRIMYPHGDTIRHSETRFGELKESKITHAIIKLLEKQGKLVTSIGSDGLEVGDRPVKIQDIYNRFTQDRSKPFILDMRSVGEAVQDGLRAGKFGYFVEPDMKDGKYVVDSGIGFEWNGYLVGISMAYVPELTPPPPI